MVLAVSFVLERSALARPIRYAELARALDAAPGEPPAARRRRARRCCAAPRKGMVLDPADPDSVSAGSFFVNPILADRRFAALERRAARGWATTSGSRMARADGSVKTSAAWLIERAGFHRGYGDGRAGISSKHTLAIINRGGATQRRARGARARDARRRTRRVRGDAGSRADAVGIELYVSRP